MNINRVAPLVALGTVVLLLPLFSPPARADPMRDARQELSRVRSMIERELRARPEMQEATAEWIDLRREYQALRKAVIAELTRDATYLAARDEMWQTQDALDALFHKYRNGIAPQDQVHAMSFRILELGGTLSRMEQDTLSRHHDLLLARRAYLESARRLAQLHRELREDVRSDPRFREALGNLLELQGRSIRVPTRP